MSSAEDSRGSGRVHIYVQSRSAGPPAVSEYGVFLATNTIGTSLALLSGNRLKKGTPLERGGRKAPGLRPLERREMVAGLPDAAAPQPVFVAMKESSMDTPPRPEVHAAPRCRA